MKLDALLVNFPDELFNDAKWHLREAESHATRGDDATFDLWREVRATSIYAIAAVDSFINNIAHWHVQKNPTLDQIAKDYLLEQQSQLENGQLKTRKRYLSLDEKFNGWTKVITGNVFDKSDVVWQDFKEVIDFRDSLIHYRPTTAPSVYDRGTIETARKAVISAQAVMQRFYKCWNKPAPPWITESYRLIK